MAGDTGEPWRALWGCTEDSSHRAPTTQLRGDRATAPEQLRMREGGT